MESAVCPHCGFRAKAERGEFTAKEVLLVHIDAYHKGVKPPATVRERNPRKGSKRKPSKRKPSKRSGPSASRASASKRKPSTPRSSHVRRSP